MDVAWHSESQSFVGSKRHWAWETQQKRNARILTLEEAQQLLPAEEED